MFRLLYCLYSSMRKPAGQGSLWQMAGKCIETPEDVHSRKRIIVFHIIEAVIGPLCRWKRATVSSAGSATCPLTDFNGKHSRGVYNTACFLQMSVASESVQKYC
jgi:hypothetical protein